MLNFLFILMNQQSLKKITHHASTGNDHICRTQKKLQGANQSLCIYVINKNISDNYQQLDCYYIENTVTQS